MHCNRLMPKENLIILPDSPYSKWIIDRCEKVNSGKNHYITFCSSIPSYPLPMLDIKGVSLAILREVANSLKEYKSIVLHYHNDVLGFLLEYGKVNPDKVSWVLWSGDLYNSPFFDRPIYLSKTKAFTEGSILKRPKGANWIKELLKFYLRRPGYFTYKNSFQRVGTIASFFEGDVAHASRVFKKQYRHLPFALLSFEELVKGIPAEKISKPGEKILLGHAGVPENNHFDLFPKLENLAVNRLLVCPLSYGNSIYIEAVSNYGKSLFGDRFETIVDFLPRDEYYLKLSEMGFAVFNTLIQQAFGNILGLLYMGVKVFLNPENSIYQQLKGIGVTVFSIDELTEQSLRETLSKAQINSNQELLKINFSEDKVNEYYSRLLKFTPELIEKSANFN